MKRIYIYMITILSFAGLSNANENLREGFCKALAQSYERYNNQEEYLIEEAERFKMAYFSNPPYMRELDQDIYVPFTKMFWGYLCEGRDLDVDFIQKVLYDEAVHSPVRMRAGLLLYVHSGETKVMSELVKISPMSLYYVTRIPDRSFFDVVNIYINKWVLPVINLKEDGDTGSSAGQVGAVNARNEWNSPFYYFNSPIYRELLAKCLARYKQGGGTSVVADRAVDIEENIKIYFRMINLVEKSNVPMP